MCSHNRHRRHCIIGISILVLVMVSDETDKKRQPNWVSILDLNQNSGFVCTLLNRDAASKQEQPAHCSTIYLFVVHLYFLVIFSHLDSMSAVPIQNNLLLENSYSSFFCKGQEVAKKFDLSSFTIIIVTLVNRKSYLYTFYS